MTTLSVVERIVQATAREIVAEGKLPTRRRIYHRTRGGSRVISNPQVSQAIRSLRARDLMPGLATEEARP